MRISCEFSCCIDGENRLEIVASCLQSNAVLYILDKRVPMVKIELSASWKIGLFSDPWLPIEVLEIFIFTARADSAIVLVF